jgi:four helix bundle protein
MTSYRDLTVWRKALVLAKEVYRVSRSFPAREAYGLTSQIQRAVSSIPANIAEGWGRGSRREYIQFLKISRGSLFELETHLFLSRELSYLAQKDLAALLLKTEEAGKMLNGLITSLEKKSPTPDLLTPNP